MNAFFLYPGRAVVHSHSRMAIRSIEESFDSEGWAPRLVPMAGLVLFPVNTVQYIVAELWGTLSVSFLLWGYLNEITPKEAAKRYYGVLGLGAQAGPICSGKVLHVISGVCGRGDAAFLKTINYVTIAAEVFIAIFVGGYAFMQMYVMKLPQFRVKKEKEKTVKLSKQNKAKLGIAESVKYCLKSPYVLAMGGLVFAYGFVMVIAELSYKDVMKLAVQNDANAYSGMRGLESNYGALMALFLMLFVSHNVIRVFGWTFTASSTPILCTVTVSTFYVWCVCSRTYSVDPNDPKMFQPVDPGADIGMWLGLLFVVVTKAAKYALFDPAKELAFLPLTSEQRFKAKAAVDIVGAKFGKGGAALFNIFVLNWILTKKSTVEEATQMIAFGAVILMVALWVCSTMYLAKTMRIKNQMDRELHASGQIVRVTVTRDLQNGGEGQQK